MLVRDLPQDDGLRLEDCQIEAVAQDLRAMGVNVWPRDYGCYFVRRDPYDGNIIECYALEGCVPWLWKSVDILVQDGKVAPGCEQSEDDPPCLREWDEDGFWCMNGHTGCLYNDGLGTCIHDGNDLQPLED